MTDPNEALADVRRAYRLVWAYQRRLMDMVQVVADGFPMHEFYAWSPVETARPAQLTTNPFKRWAWDTLPFYKMSALYLPATSKPNDLKRGDWMLEINVNADNTPFWDHTGEPDASLFPDAESSASTLKLVAWQCTKNVKTNWYWNVWGKGEWPQTDLEVLDQTALPVRTLALSSGLEVVVDRPAIQSFVNDFKKALTQHLGIAH